MKKLKLYIVGWFATILVLSGCVEPKVDSLFEDNANTRVTKKIAEYKNALTGSATGWRAAYYPDGGQAGGYSFFLNFNADGTLSMYSDIYLDATDQAFQTSYQIKALQKPTLIFDSYAYLHELVNPDYNGGTGAFADLELEFETVEENKIVLKGIRNNTEMVLTKMTPQEFDSLKKGGLATIFTGTLDYIFGEKFIYLNGPTGQRADVLIDFNNKQFVLFFVSNRNVTVQNVAFITTPTGISFKNPIAVFGVNISELLWDATNKRYYYINAGQRINFSEGDRPSLSFYNALGVLFTDAVFDLKIPSQSNFYKEIYGKIKEKTISLTTTPPTRVLGDVYLNFFADAGLFLLISPYTRTYTDRVDSFGAVVVYVPSLDSNGNIVFTRRSDTYTLVDGQFFSGASGIVLEGIKELTDVLETSSFKWDYDPVESKTSVLTSAQDPAIVIKGKLR